MAKDARDPTSHLNRNRERFTYQGANLARELAADKRRAARNARRNAWAQLVGDRRRRRIARYLGLLDAPDVVQTEAIRGVLEMRPLAVASRANVLRVAVEVSRALPTRTPARDITDLVRRVLIGVKPTPDGVTLADVPALVASVCTHRDDIIAAAADSDTE